MGVIAEMTKAGDVFSDGMDSVVIRNVVGEIIGGRTLDTTGFDGKTVRAGHIIICETDTDTWKPLPVKDGKYEALPEGHTYEGVMRSSRPKEEPLAPIMYAGEVNDVASPYPVSDELKSKLKEALPGLYFKHE